MPSENEELARKIAAGPVMDIQQLDAQRRGQYVEAGVIATRDLNPQRTTVNPFKSMK